MVAKGHCDSDCDPLDRARAVELLTERADVTYLGGAAYNRPYNRQSVSQGFIANKFKNLYAVGRMHWSVLVMGLH